MSQFKSELKVDKYDVDTVSEGFNLYEIHYIIFTRRKLECNLSTVCSVAAAHNLWPGLDPRISRKRSLSGHLWSISVWIDPRRLLVGPRVTNFVENLSI